MNTSKASVQNKKAWEHRAYEFWVKRFGQPNDLACRILKNPEAQLKKHRSFFKNITGKKIANLCGSNGRKAVPLALLGAEVTVFDISEENKQYALKLAKSASTTIDYVVTDIYDINQELYGGQFDILYLEGGILHYFHELDRFMSFLYTLLKTDGQLILSDFHPIKRCIVQGTDGQFLLQPAYFDEDIHSGDIAFKQAFSRQEQADFPDVSVRYYTLSEIINSVIATGFKLQRLEEHRGWNNENIPWELTISAVK